MCIKISFFCWFTCIVNRSIRLPWSFLICSITLPVRQLIVCCIFLCEARRILERLLQTHKYVLANGGPWTYSTHWKGLFSLFILDFFWNKIMNTIRSFNQLYSRFPICRKGLNVILILAYIQLRCIRLPASIVVHLSMFQLRLGVTFRY